MSNAILTPEEKDTLKSAIIKVLDEYQWQHTDDALDKIIDTWACNKRYLIELFKAHPNYVEGKFMIAFDADYERGINRDAICNFREWVQVNLDNITIPDELNERRILDGCIYLPNREFSIIKYFTSFNDQYLSSEEAAELREWCPETHAHKGQKTSRVMNKFLTYIGFDKLPDYQKEFAKYADALSPMTIKRHTVFSLHPVDYLTMSFGNSWSSCHSIDKMNLRDMPNNYRGDYCSGTMSYMLDIASMVFYTVDADYNGNEYYTQPKIIRQMYHYGNEKLIQGRLYPSGNDGATEIYTQYRQVAQKVMSELLDIPNLWTLKRGSYEIEDYVESYGTHYEDYTHYGECTISFVKGSDNSDAIEIGHNPICIYCGDEHGRTNRIDCCNPYGPKCPECGEIIDLQNDRYVTIDGVHYHYGCVDYCHECGRAHIKGTHEMITVGDNTVCRECYDRWYKKCDCCGKMKHEAYLNKIDDKIVCDSCRREHYARCYYCNTWHKRENMRQTNGRWTCSECPDYEPHHDRFINIDPTEFWFV